MVLNMKNHKDTKQETERPKDQWNEERILYALSGENRHIEY